MATIDAHYFNVCVRGAERRGYDSCDFYQRAGIDPSRFRNLAARGSAESMATMVRDIWGTMDDEFMGYTAVPCKAGSFAVMVEYAFHSETVLKALTKGIEFYRLLTDDIVTEISVDGEAVVLSTRFRRPELDPDHYFVEFWLIIWHRLACWFAGETLPLKGAGFSYERPQTYFEEFQYLFPCSLSFNEEVCSLRFLLADLSVPIRKNESELKEMLAKAPLDMMTIPASDTSIARKVREVLLPRKKGVFIARSAGEVAGKIGVSAVVMRRRLRAEGTSFRAIAEQIRRDIACAKLRSSPDSIEDIAADLGYLETRSFTRAFRCWTGHSPLEYRRKRKAA